MDSTIKLEERETSDEYERNEYLATMDRLIAYDIIMHLMETGQDNMSDNR